MRIACEQTSLGRTLQTMVDAVIIVAYLSACSQSYNFHFIRCISDAKKRTKVFGHALFYPQLDAFDCRLGRVLDAGKRI